MVTIDRVEPLLASDAGGTLTLADNITLTFGSSRISWLKPNAAESSLNIDDLLGCAAFDEPPRLALYGAPRGRGGCFSVKAPARQRVDVVLPCQFFEQATSIKASISKLIGEEIRPTRWLVLINPFGGGGKAKSVWAKLSKLLDPVGLTLEVIETTHAGHAHELAASLTVGAHDGILSVSGDGLVNEFVNGLMSRADAAAAAAAMIIFPAPGGSANGLFRSICAKCGEAHDLLGAAMILARGRATPLDLWEYSIRPDPDYYDHKRDVWSQAAVAAVAAPATADVEAAALPVPSEIVWWSFLSFAWGLVSDVDIESEVLRCCGSLRFDLWAVWRVLTLRQYMGTLSYLDAATDEWNEISASNIVGIWACNVPYMSEKDFAAPEAQFDNGVLDMLLLAGTTRMQVRASAQPL